MDQRWNTKRTCKESDQPDKFVEPTIQADRERRSPRPLRSDAGSHCGQVSRLAPRPHFSSGSASDTEFSNGLPRIVWAITCPQEPCDRPDLAPFSRAAGAGDSVRRQFLLHGLSLHAGAKLCPALRPATAQLAPKFAQQVALH